MSFIKVFSIFLTMYLFMISCHSEWKELPEVIKLDKLKHTDFVIALEVPIKANRNMIYTPMFLFAWDKIKTELQVPIIIGSKNSLDFNYLNKSKSHLYSLNEHDYSVQTDVDGNEISVEVIFNKMLPFKQKLQVVEPIIFNKTKVSAFGMQFFDEDLINFAKILYYKDDNNFILKLIPKDIQNEIILVKGLNHYRSLKEALIFADNLIEIGTHEQKDPRKLWKYQITDKDQFRIPVIKFNVETKYKTIENQTFTTRNKQKHQVVLAYQRTGFIFNENGAVVESEAGVMKDSVGFEPIKIYPKNMTFNQPFLIFIKQTKHKNPYFVMKVENTELMTKK